ncbi:hypothetical protein JR316_0011238 [Psilocybe cubensis]|uniref:Uncharacterized protein n=2 Tax=Psilocybe cubensis TaxID=181762 RepID=A0ACB8GJJ6_PSICU|nr:hypothetical protein JR316_0011238 [Psilocybe cubensis]KAH9475679.1 hypothetical protein JR316_0011238 [Psilocybe cubensis]
MPKHIPSEHYVGKSYEVTNKTFIHPEIEHHDHPSDAEHYLLPTVFTIQNGASVLAKYPGPGVYHITEGECLLEYVTEPVHSTTISAGSVIHVEEGASICWICGSPSGVKGFAAFHVPVSVKGIDDDELSWLYAVHNTISTSK